MSPRAAVADKTTATPAGPTVPAGEPRPGPLTPPEQPSPPSEPTPAPAPDPDDASPTLGARPATSTEQALARVRTAVARGELGVGALCADLTPQQLRDEALDLMTEAGLAGEPLRDEHPLTVWEAIAEVTRRVKVIAKDKQTTGGERFYFRGIDDALAALHPLLGDVGLVLLPGEVVRESWDTRTTAKGGTLNVARLLVRYRLIGPDGTSTTGEAWGEAGDSGDKATQKAHSQSYKTFVFQAFSIPTQQSAADEPDAVHEVAAPFSEAQRARAGAAWQAARQATGMPVLVAVREQAAGEGLLDCPVAADRDGRPLGVLLDERRRELARAVAEQAPA